MSMPSLEGLIPPEVVEGIKKGRFVSAKEFFDQVGRELSDLKNIGRVSGNDFLLALLAANLGIAHDPIVTTKPVAAGVSILKEDIIPFLPNSRLLFYVQIATGAANSIINLRTKFSENQVIDGQVLDGVPLVAGVPKEFNVPVSRRQKFNLTATTATTIAIVRVIEFRLGL